MIQRAFGPSDDDEVDGDETGESSDEDLDRDFPLGDGTVDTDATVLCPYCGESNSVALDPGSGSVQSYVEDCQVCCRPWAVNVRFHADGSANVTADPAD